MNSKRISINQSRDLLIKHDIIAWRASQWAQIYDSRDYPKCIIKNKKMLYTNTKWKKSVIMMTLFSKCKRTVFFKKPWFFLKLKVEVYIPERLKKLKKVY